ncbi:MAG: outer membrane beta-barrel protein [Vibrio litoralis]|uniref:outer membrane beta-barrel protein n=1 Tax=Vibrio litoralis TaxID=335972 RepID=UPI003F964115
MKKLSALLIALLSSSAFANQDDRISYTYLSFNIGQTKMEDADDLGLEDDTANSYKFRLSSETLNQIYLLADVELYDYDLTINGVDADATISIARLGVGAYSNTYDKIQAYGTIYAVPMWSEVEVNSNKTKENVLGYGGEIGIRFKPVKYFEWDTAVSAIGNTEKITGNDSESQVTTSLLFLPVQPFSIGARVSYMPRVDYLSYGAEVRFNF